MLKKRNALMFLSKTCSINCGGIVKIGNSGSVNTLDLKILGGKVLKENFDY